MSTRLFNRTRRTDDLLAKFRNEGRWYLVPLFHLLRLSDFAREGIENSGSYRFADHMYRNVPSGRGRLGRWLDRLLLNLPASRSMRSRCAEATSAMHQAFNGHLGSRPFRLLTVPCGLPRDVREFASEVEPSRVDYVGIDLDPAVLTAAQDFLSSSPIAEAKLIRADALEIESWPQSGSFDFISSTGLGEFLSDEQLQIFYANVHAALRPGGTFFTSAAACEPRADRLMSVFEFHAHYRTRVELERILAALPWKSIEWSHDTVGLQTFARARK